MGWPGVSAPHSHSGIQADKGNTLCSLVFLVTAEGRGRECMQISHILFCTLLPFLTEWDTWLHVTAKKLESVAFCVLGRKGRLNVWMCTGTSNVCHGPEVISEFSRLRENLQKRAIARWMRDKELTLEKNTATFLLRYPGWLGNKKHLFRLNMDLANARWEGPFHSVLKGHSAEFSNVRKVGLAPCLPH